MLQGSRGAAHTSPCDWIRVACAEALLQLPCSRSPTENLNKKNVLPLDKKFRRTEQRIMTPATMRFKCMNYAELFCEKYQNKQNTWHNYTVNIGVKLERRQ